MSLDELKAIAHELRKIDTALQRAHFQMPQLNPIPDIAAYQREIHVARARALQAHYQADPSDYGFMMEGHQGDAEVFATLAGTFTHTMQFVGGIQDANKTVDTTIEFAPEDWKVLQERTLFIFDQGFDQLSDYGHEHLDGAIDEMRTMIARAAREGKGAGALWQQFQTEYLDRYTDWEFARLARTEMAFANSAARQSLFHDLFDAQRNDIEGAAKKFGLVFDGPPIHPNCECTTTIIEHNGQIYEIIWPNPTACEVCVGVTDWIMEQIFGADYTNEVTDWPDVDQEAGDAFVDDLEGAQEGAQEPVLAGTV